MISGCHDVQTSADANITAFQLPDPAGRRGGACTAALLQVLYNEDKGAQDNSADMSWVEVLRAMRENLAAQGYSQVPQLSSSRIIDVNEKMEIVKDPEGAKRAVLIGINYVGQQGELSGCHNDVKNINSYLQRVLGFERENMKVLMDDGMHEEPTFENIVQAFKWVVKESEPGDTVWIHYSGHGGRLEDQDGDEDDGYDETLIPVDFQSEGQIRDDDLLKYLVQPMSEGVTMTCLMDCCHSGTVLDLPYRFIADGDHVEMERNENFEFKDMLAAAAGVAAVAADIAEAAGLLDECCNIL
ncbi:hypothetical protein ACHAXS_003261 [Conticribra weissflogii]